MVTSSLSCNVAEDGMHAYWNVTNLAYNRQALTVVATADEVAMKEVYKKVGIVVSTEVNMLTDSPIGIAGLRFLGIYNPR